MKHNPRLRKEVENLLDAADRAWAFLASDWAGSDPGFVARERRETVAQLAAALKASDDLPERVDDLT